MSEYARADELPPMDDYGDEELRSARRSWQRVDLTDVLSGRYTPPAPTVGTR